MTYLDNEYRKRMNLQKQLAHPFYKEVEDFMSGIKMEQLEKAAEKYDEPFNPSDWTPQELVTHAMQENYDQQNYIYGLYLAIKHLEQQNEQLSKELTDQISNTKFWYDKASDYKKKLTKYKYDYKG